MRVWLSSYFLLLLFKWKRKNKIDFVEMFLSVDVGIVKAAHSEVCRRRGWNTCVMKLDVNYTTSLTHISSTSCVRERDISYVAAPAADAESTFLVEVVELYLPHSRVSGTSALLVDGLSTKFCDSSSRLFLFTRWYFHFTSFTRKLRRR